MIVLVNKLWGITIAFALFPFIFIKRNAISHRTLTHELIHIEQQKETLVFIGLIWYVIEYLLKLVYYKFDRGRAYRAVSFEREAYLNETDSSYLEERKRYSFLKYVFSSKNRLS